MSAIFVNTKTRRPTTPATPRPDHATTPHATSRLPRLSGGMTRSSGSHMLRMFSSAPVDKPLAPMLRWVAPAVAIPSMIMDGTFERNPGAPARGDRVDGELGPRVPADAGERVGLLQSRHAGPIMELSLPPSAYFFRQVRV